MSDGVQRFDADFKKIPGTVSITDGHIYWVPREAGKMDRQGQSMSRVTSASPFAFMRSIHEQIC